MKRHRTAFWLALALPLVVSPARAPARAGGAGAAAGTGPHVLVDRLVAVVDDDPILLSDVERAISLGLVERQAGESRSRLERRVLDRLIDQRLRLHEIERHNFAPLPPDEIDRQLELLRARFAGPEELSARLAELGLDEAGLRLLVARQLRVLVYVEKRLGPRVFVQRDDARAYYDDELAAELAGEGLEPPPFEEVREQIRELLTERQLNREIDVWTAELRRAAEVDDYLERAGTELPPVVRRIED